MKKLTSSFKDALKGIRHVFHHEQNFRIHTFISALLIVFGFIGGWDSWKWAIAILAIMIVLSLEVINSVIEYTWNHLEPNHHPVVGTIKDVMAGAVLLASIGAGILGIMLIFFM